ncbi:hypothetical protein [Metabacillus niabensis]|uniref:hypothetical protein n=1 Tax=Metabacillus niabensis TaxID=324854 RepID=UPI001CFB7063|nr:hypothetical protein [Metabacillus niabensis]
MMLWESFDKNEIYILVMLLLTYTAILVIPKKLPLNFTLLFLTWGLATSTLIDFTIGGGLIDFYKVNDSNTYELTDFLTYFLFPPFSYFFIYFYEVLNINKKRFILYILGWTIVGLATEKLCTIMGVTHYQHGYKIHFSLVVFLLVQTTTALYYELIKKKLKIT